MRCQYCFYADEMKNREYSAYGLMDEKLLEIIVKKTISSVSYSCTFAFQGGEPTLIGLPFYRKLIELERKYNTSNIKINNVIQTNGSMIDEEWAIFFKKNNFLIGISLDGLLETHNKYRQDENGKGDYQRVMRAIQLLNEYQVEYNILTVVTANVAKQIKRIYRFYKENHFVYQQYIPCMDPLQERKGSRDYSLTPELYGRFLKDLFDLWYADLQHNNIVYIRDFENLVAMTKGCQADTCGMKGFCGEQWIIEANGDVFPCDFYALDNWRLGNIQTDTYEQMNIKRFESGFVQSSAHHNEDCTKCKWYALCRNGCQRYREKDTDLDSYKNYFCEGYYDFYNYVAPKLLQLSKNYIR
jgi:uncharacterized protein